MNYEEKQNYYVGLDIGTNSVGIAAADKDYNLIKYKGAPIWCSHLFDEASRCSERRLFRTGRRRLDRRQQRVRLVDEIFAPEVCKVDKRFYIRKKESALWQEDKMDNTNSNMYFADENFTDKDYFHEFPTIHHLIVALMEEDRNYDIRLVNIAVDWLVAHRGHFLSEINVENVDKITDFSTVYEGVIDFFETEGLMDYYSTWTEGDCAELEKVIKSKIGVTAKRKALKEILYNGKAPNDDAPYKHDIIINFLAGGKIKANDLFTESIYESDFAFKISDNMEEVLLQLGDDAEFVSRLLAIYEWSVLSDILDGEKYISKAKKKVYDQHKADLKFLKAFVREYAPEKYNLIFRETKKKLKNYTAYSYNLNAIKGKDELPEKKATQQEFLDFLKKTIDFDKLSVNEKDKQSYEDMKRRIENGQFMPKQVNSDNRVIPHQLYQIELKKILDKAERYLPFLREKDVDGYVTKEKIMSIFTFKIPYYVGPLRKDNGNNAWLVREKGKIYPWNFNEMVDKDASEQEFIRRMTNECTYIPGENVLPKCSLVYSKFMVLNEINNLRVNGLPISVEVKQKIYTELYEKNPKVTAKMIRTFLETNHIIEKDDMIEGIDVTIKSSMKSRYEFRRLLTNGILNEDEVERIIERNTYTEDRGRYRKWLEKQFPKLSVEDVKYVGKLKYKDFGRLSRKMLMGLKGTDTETGETGSIMYFLWNTNDNFMQLLSSRYTFMMQIEAEREKYYEGKEVTLEERLDAMCVSNAVKRPIIRTLDVVNDVVSTIGHAPDRIFVEMARGVDPEKKGRTKTRKQQLLELYQNAEEDTQILEKELEDMGDMANNQLQSEAVFLYYLQLGKCAYSGESIDLSLIKSGKYNVDHIYPQCYVKDDSILNNKVLVLSELNAEKGDTIPISKEIRKAQKGFWDKLHKAKLMTDEKYRRLTRSIPFSNDEKLGFIDRQLVETRQSMKAVTQILQQVYPETEIVYVKAGLVSDFRKEFLTPKSRIINDLHHAKDAYLNIVVGNVYHERFTKKWFKITDRYSVNPKTIFKRKVVHGTELIWEPDKHLPKVKAIYKKNNIKMTRYAYCQRGGLFDQMPIKKKEGLVPLKKGLDSQKYGGYNKSSATFFTLAVYDKGEKRELSFVPIELMVSKRILVDEIFAKEYVRTQLQKLNKKTISNIEFPLGMRPIKYKAVLSLDGYEVWVNGKANNGAIVLLSSAESLIVSKEMEIYIKKLENYVRKREKKLNIILDESHDGITQEENEKVYECLSKKLKQSIFCKMPGCQSQIVSEGKERFQKMAVEQQVDLLLNLIDLMKSGRAGGRDLRAIGGKEKSGAMSLGANLSSSAYEEIRIIDYSPAGLHRKVSVNLKDFLK